MSDSTVNVNAALNTTAGTAHVGTTVGTADAAATDAAPLLSVRHLRKSYGSHEVLKDISFDVMPGEVVVLVGPSGSGKSTLIRCLNGLEDIQDGEISFNGRPVSRNSEKAWRKLRTRIGMVFQSYDLFPNLSVAKNIELGPTAVQKRAKAEVDEQMDRLLADVQLSQYKDSYPRELSGGQKQRIAIVRALAMNPELMLFDEVTASLDPEMVREVLELMLRLAKRRMTMIVVTHEMEFARRVADTVMFLEDGVILERQPGGDFFSSPQTDRAKRFLESMSPVAAE
ncbi:MULTISPECIES: amino acid ABC transporter ATP-binding protein [Bifidobacterium]|jgi:polar amino acid transport system ATP-binding protein|uniref:Amino acid ABC transporter ATP-binding protein n=1 Tax=Bifidobacterium tibiigranuli TaxID=2172043 RepID=A0A5N6S6Q8_9BIFI|nr:amino acid ABC transporter ATP-binding protein [Bifidobacterium tibiigranuli]KAE8130293.1 amino acid ABC transporter ATP-binding protein [Bifidobacterium tibiigranuli]KAE8130348.1 amino acid ABC transporter ATP-binding protein [Bifidobacterium tibiigranuli]